MNLLYSKFCNKTVTPNENMGFEENITDFSNKAVQQID